MDIIEEAIKRIKEFGLTDINLPEDFDGTSKINIKLLTLCWSCEYKIEKKLKSFRKIFNDIIKYEADHCEIIQYPIIYAGEETHGLTLMFYKTLLDPTYNEIIFTINNLCKNWSESCFVNCLDETIPNQLYEINWNH